MSTLLAQFASTTEGTSQTVTFDQPSTPGKSIVAVISASAVISGLPAGWAQTQLDLDATDFSVFVLPAASHTVPITGLTFNLSALRHAVAVVWEDVVTGSALKYTGSVWGTASGSDLGTGLHTVTADKAFALYALTTNTAPGAPITVTLSSQDQGFTSFADSGSNPVGSFEVGRVYVGQGGPVDWPSNGVTATFSGTLVGIPSTISTIIAYDSEVDTTPPGPVTGLTATPASSSVTLNWTNPGEDESQIIVRGAQGLTAPATPTDGYSVSTAVTTTAVDSGLTSNTDYSYSVFARDSSGNTSTVVSVTTTTLTGAVNPIPAENALTGVDKTNWIFGSNEWTRPGYAVGFSADSGTTLDFKVDSPNAFDLKIFRLGYYGGLGSRLVDTVSGTAFTQPAATVDGTTQAASCAGWTVNASWAIPANAVSGLYIGLVVDGSNFYRIPFVVTNDRVADIIVKTSESTWQAYNAFGGRSLYSDPRAYAVSYDRPFDNEHVYGSQTSYLNSEWALIAWIEQQGYDVKYVSTLDVEQTPDILSGAKVIVSSGHDEYTSQNVWDRFVAARDAGANLWFCSGNEFFWRTRYEGNTMICYKGTKGGAQLDPVEPTGTWQDTRSFNDATRRNPSSLIGQRFIANGIRDDALIVTDEFKDMPIWRNTTVAALTTGQSNTYPSLVGFEWDQHFPAEAPENKLFASDQDIYLTNMMSDVNGELYDLTGQANHKLVFIKNTSGSITAGFGTNQWAWGLSELGDRGTPRSASLDIQQATFNMLTDMGVAADNPDGALVVTAAETWSWPNTNTTGVMRIYHNGAWVTIGLPNI